MEKLDNSWNIHIHYDIRFLFDDCRWPISSHDNGKHLANSLESKFLMRNFQLFSDSCSAGEMFSRDNFNWLPSLSHSRFAMVQKSFVVFPVDFQLFLLWRKSIRLLWRRV